MNPLDARLLQAHAAGDGAALARLYEEAARQAADADAGAFYLTHAHIFALEGGCLRPKRSAPNWSLWGARPRPGRPCLLYTSDAADE